MLYCWPPRSRRSLLLPQTCIGPGPGQAIDAPTVDCLFCWHVDLPPPPHFIRPVAQPSLPSPGSHQAIRACHRCALYTKHRLATASNVPFPTMANAQKDHHQPRSRLWPKTLATRFRRNHNIPGPLSSCSSLQTSRETGVTLQYSNTTCIVSSLCSLIAALQSRAAYKPFHRRESPQSSPKCPLAPKTLPPLATTTPSLFGRYAFGTR